MLRAEGYDALGIDPEAPEGAHYRRIEFERADLPRQVDAVVASTSLHHVANPAQVIDRIRETAGGDAVRLGEGRALGFSLDGKSVLARTEESKLAILPAGMSSRKSE